MKGDASIIRRLIAADAEVNHEDLDGWRTIQNCVYVEVRLVSSMSEKAILSFNNHNLD